MDKSQPASSTVLDEDAQNTQYKVIFIKDNLIGESTYNRVYKGLRVKDQKQVAIITWKHLPPPLSLTKEVSFSIPKAMSARYYQHPFILQYMGYCELDNNVVVQVQEMSTTRVTLQELLIDRQNQPLSEKELLRYFTMVCVPVFSLLKTEIEVPNLDPCNVYVERDPIKGRELLRIANYKPLKHQDYNVKKRNCVQNLGFELIQPNQQDFY